MARSIGALIDKLYELQQQRLEIERKASAAVAKIVTQEETLEAQLFARFQDADLDGARGLTAASSVSSTDVPTVTDWNEVYDYIRNKGSRSGPRFELLHKRLSSSAWNELRDSGLLVPGTAVFTRKKIKISKIKARSRRGSSGPKVDPAAAKGSRRRAG